MALQTSSAQLEALCQESQQSSVLLMQWLFTITAVVIVSLRLYCRTKFGKGLGLDDYVLVAGAIVGLPNPFLVTKWVHTGLGKHIQCLDPARAYATLQWSIASQALHIACLGLVKVSLCLCVLRVIDRVERRISTFLWVNIALVGATHAVQLAMLLAECRPLNALWDLGVHGTCYSPDTTYITTYVAFSLDAFTDLVCSGIPIFVIYRMQMNMRTKVALCVLMGLGVFAEQALSLILVSLPILRPFFLNFFTLTESDRPSSRIPNSNRGFFRRAPPDYSLFNSTNNSNRLRNGNDAPYTPIEDGYVTRRFPQIPLAAYRVERPVELNMGVKYDDLEKGQWVGP
ncbi:MAG: hypothetical protein ASARMPREDX12_000373 [Alectoria sarmentosa]|nr:MAG: hypothetical protein ASARMPREDX12_000373 [Alectoria sarmentosa]